MVSLSRILVDGDLTTCDAPVRQGFGSLTCDLHFCCKPRTFKQVQGCVPGLVHEDQAPSLLQVVGIASCKPVASIGKHAPTPKLVLRYSLTVAANGELTAEEEAIVLINGQAQ